MKVTLRKRLKNNKVVLYLDYYNKGKRKTEYLKLFLHPDPKTKSERDFNKKSSDLAESIWAKRQLEIQNGIYGFQDLEKLNGSLFNFIQKLIDEKANNNSNIGNWESMFNHLKAYSPNDITFKSLDKEYVEGFKTYLKNDAKTKSKKPLSQNSKYSYFGKFKAALKQVVSKGVLKVNPGENIEHFKQGEPQREFLTLDELQAVSQEECEIPLLKKAFLFSALTGLRWSDVKKLLWSEIQHSKELSYYIRFRQKKTKGAETLPISEQAYNLLGEQEENANKIFEHLHYSAWTNLKLQQWIMRAGITKPITFHYARHTYATLQLTMGTDIYTVSKLLGHKELKTTQIYTKVIDKKKTEAANRIKLDL